MDFRAIDVSDETSGLPPLREVDPDRVVTLFAFDTSQEGMLAFQILGDDGSHGDLVGDIPTVVYLSVRGWRVAAAGESSSWAQLHVAIPRDLLGSVIAGLASHLVAGG